MAISLKDISNSKNHEDDSILDAILRRKEARSRLKQKGEAKLKLQRPWENQADLVSKRVTKKSRVMKPFSKSNSEFSEDKLFRKIKGRALALFSALNMTDL